MQTQENGKKFKKEIVAVISVALVCLIVAAVFIIQYAVRTYNEEKAINELAQSFGEKLEDSSKKAEEIKKTVNLDLVGTYQSKGEISGKDQAAAVAAMKLLPDGKVDGRNFNNEKMNGWWVSSKKGDVEFIAIGFEGQQGISMYQVSGSYIMDVKSLYYGKIEKASSFDTTLICESPTGKLTLDLDKNGNARGNFIDTNEKSENNGVTFALKGSYSVDGEFIDITLNGAQTRFLMFDYGVEDTDNDSGMASIYFEKID